MIDEKDYRRFRAETRAKLALLRDSLNLIVKDLNETWDDYESLDQATNERLDQIEERLKKAGI